MEGWSFPCLEQQKGVKERFLKLELTQKRKKERIKNDY